MRLSWYKLPEQLLNLSLPFSAIILAAILYDADRKNTGVVTIRQLDVAKTMHTRPNTISEGIRHLERAGIILSHKRIRDATRITLKPDVIPPRQPSGQASRHKAIPVPANSSIDLTEAEKLFNSQ